MPKADAPKGGDSELPREPRNRNVRCKGRTLIRYEHDTEDNRKGDPILDEDGARCYRPCIAFGANGTDYCSVHGGSAPQTINAAKRTLALAAHNVADVLAAIAIDERVVPETRIKAIVQILDRVGVRAGVEISLDTPGWQKVLGKLYGVEDVEDTAEPEVEADPWKAPLTGIEVRDPETAKPVAKPEPRKRVAKKAAPPDNVVQINRKKATPPEKPKFEGW